MLAPSVPAGLVICRAISCWTWVSVTQELKPEESGQLVESRAGYAWVSTIAWLFENDCEAPAKPDPSVYWWSTAYDVRVARIGGHVGEVTLHQRLPSCSGSGCSGSQKIR